MARVPHPCVLNEACSVDFWVETDTGSPDYGKLIVTDRFSADPCNIVTCKPDGLFVPEPGMTPLTFPDQVQGVPPFSWTTSPPPSPPGAVIASATLSTTVPGTACAGTRNAQVTASITPLTVTNGFDALDFPTWAFEVVSWTIGAATGGPTVVGSVIITSSLNGALMTGSIPTFTHTSAVVGGDTVAITARLVFYGSEPGVYAGYFSASSQAATITLGAAVL